ncbi:MAG: type II/IV secretion system protein [Methylobacteriaceae bacterium]|nr:type II/IV secretion system protein [Methylobacteriaceae bacterium]MBV9246450.1 type II/IV secretion system protein [Methylobacteriaceae bacterium]
MLEALPDTHSPAAFAAFMAGEAGGNVAVGDAGQTFRHVFETAGLPARQFADAMARFLSRPRIAYGEMMAAEPLTARFSRRFLRDTGIFAFRGTSGEPALAVAEPPTEAVVRAAEIVLGGMVALHVASYDDLSQVLAERLGADAVAVEPQEAEPARDGHDDVESLRDLASGAPVVRAVNDVLEKAVELRATDVHIEPFRTGLAVRLRIDGLLRPVPAPPIAMAQAIVSRIKILAGLNIAERRLPQDGAARLRLAGTDIDVRVATMPTGQGESAVIRLLPRDRGLLDMARIGLNPRDESIMRRLLRLPHGMIAITGPTGSGKTTTLACALSILNEPLRKILTIEDPIEYEIPGVNQSQVKPSIGLTFATAMRAFVRQDPDVIMVGEVRDSETADTAIHAALTGHLVLTTVHTETAAAAVPRLLDLGVEGFLLQSTLRGIVAQRLVRVLCEHCKRRFTLDRAAMAANPDYAALGFAEGESVFEPVGCERCGGTGYRGRRGVFEILEVTPAVRRLIRNDSDSGTIEQAARAEGLTTMIDDAVGQCRAGLTSTAEVLRVTTVR